MKNRIKRAFLTLLMLFATLYPSGQVYANGLPPRAMTTFEKNSMVDELVKDSDFILYTISCSFIMILSKSKLETLNDKEKFSSLEIKKELLSLSLQNSDKINKKILINELGNPDSANFEILLSKLDEKKLKIINKYPQFLSMKSEDLSEITEKIRSSEIFKKNFDETHAATLTCFQNVGILYAGCVLGLNSIYNTFIAIGWAICVGAAIAIAGLLAAIGQPEFDLFMLPTAETCMKGAVYVSAVTTVTFAGCSTLMLGGLWECWEQGKRN